jgi:hypothetical protein
LPDKDGIDLAILVPAQGFERTAKLGEAREVLLVSEEVKENSSLMSPKRGSLTRRSLEGRGASRWLE